MANPRPEPVELARRYLRTEQTDLYLFSGPITRQNVDPFVDRIVGTPPSSATVSVFVTTWGGDADTGYRLTRALRSRYQFVRLLLAGPCKSAGTLVAVGAHQLRFGANGELGPLDVQITKPDELMPLSSGLDIFQALSLVNGQAFQTFEQYFLQILSSGSGNISTRTASEIATKLVTGLYTPLSAQIDPLRLGEVQRAISVAKAYGERLGLTNLKPGALDKLIEQYPSHSFVIDMQEAADLFTSVTAFTDDERALSECFRHIVRYPRTQEPFHYNIGEYVAREDAKGAGDEADVKRTGGGSADSKAAEPPSSGTPRAPAESGTAAENAPAADGADGNGSQPNKPLRAVQPNRAGRVGTVPK